MKSLFSILALFLFPGWHASASVRLPDVLSDHMVLQQDADITLWGWACVGNTVEVKTSWGANAKAIAEPSGSWKLTLRTPLARPLKDGLHPETITLTMPEENTLQITDVLIGEVWLCSGQSNMEMMLKPGYPPGWNDWYGEKFWKGDESKKADRPYLRVYDVEKTSASTPQPDVKGFLPAKCIQPEDARGLIAGRQRGWQPCTPASAGYFSAVAYYFGAALAEKLQVPVGLITSDVGGTPIQDWDKGGKFHDGMIAPFFPMTCKGVIWYQGESNVGNPPGTYSALFKDMIGDWRSEFHQEKMPFYFVQIAPFGNNPAAGQLRDEQASALSLPGTGLVVTSDIGQTDRIHPPDKRDVGQRLARQALRKTYGKTNVIADGPTFQSLQVSAGKIDVTFADPGGGLASRDGKPLTCFTVAGPDGQFVPARADLGGSRVVVTCPDGLPRPSRLRFGWGPSDQPNLMSKDGLPAAQFQAAIP